MNPQERVERNRLRRAEQRGPGRRALANRPWFIKAADFSAAYKVLEWDRQCTFCHTFLIEGEANGWCCNKGRKILPRMPAYPAILVPVFGNHNISTISIKLNRLFTFSVTGVANGSWHHPVGASTVVLGGRTYHRILPAETPGHPINWFLYDEQERLNGAAQQHVPIALAQFVSAGLMRCNPFIARFRRWHQDAPVGVGLEIIGELDLCSMMTVTKSLVLCRRFSNR